MLYDENLELNSLESKETIDKFLDYIKKERHISAVSNLLGKSDFEIIGLVRDLIDSGINIIVKQYDDGFHLLNQGDTINKDISTYNFTTSDTNEFSFVAISDTRLGSKSQQLAILNDIETASKLHKLTGKDIYMGGCLAQRLDIELPNYIKRLDVVRKVNQPLYERDLVHYEKPFWVTDFEDSNDNLAQGNLFRNFYPLKIGAGCHGKCKYCTIRHTRGENYETVADHQIEEFLQFDDIVLTSDSPTVKQIKDWCNISKKYNKPISIRNIEPQTLVMCKEEVEELSKLKLLQILHCPVQSFDEEVLRIMNRSIKFTKMP